MLKHQLFYFGMNEPDKAEGFGSEQHVQNEPQKAEVIQRHSHRNVTTYI